jgi:AraC-like DNA-binding protein
MRQSFAEWRLPKDLEGVLLLEDRRDESGWLPTQELHCHDELELHFIERGRGVFQLVSVERLVVEAGMLVWIPPRREHLLLEASADFRRWMLLCRPRVVRRVVTSGSDVLLGRSAKELFGQLPKVSATSLRQTFADVRADRAGGLSVVNAGVAFALARAWFHFSSAASRPEPAALHPAVALAVRLLREPGERLSLPDLAKQAGITESHLSKVFMAQMNTSVTEYRNRVRVEQFLQIYGDGSGLTLLDAALEAGFGSYAQFYRIFCKHMGYSPAEHRARARVAREVIQS